MCLEIHEHEPKLKVLQPCVACAVRRKNGQKRVEDKGANARMADGWNCSDLADRQSIRHVPILVMHTDRPSSRSANIYREDPMKFMLTFAMKPESRARDEAIARFKATGAQPP